MILKHVDLIEIQIDLNLYLQATTAILAEMKHVIYAWDIRWLYFTQSQLQLVKTNEDRTAFRRYPDKIYPEKIRSEKIRPEKIPPEKIPPEKIPP